jgi:hypothetical protein
MSRVQLPRLFRVERKVSVIPDGIMSGVQLRRLFRVERNWAEVEEIKLKDSVQKHGGKERIQTWAVPRRRRLFFPKQMGRLAAMAGYDGTAQ